MNRIKRTPNNPSHTFRLDITYEEAKSANLFKIAGPKAPKDLLEAIEDWVQCMRCPGIQPTHRAKKDFEPYFSAGDFFFVPKKKWIPPTWGWTDSAAIGGGVSFYKTRGHWGVRRAAKINKKGVAIDWFDYSDGWAREYLEPIRTRIS